MEEITTSNPGTTCVKARKKDGSDEYVFKRFYICFEDCKKGWLVGLFQ